MVAATHEEWSADLLNPFFEGFGDHLTVTGLAPATVDYRLRVAYQFGRWLEDSGRGFESIDSDVIQEFIKTKDRATYAGCTYQSMLGQLLLFLRMVHRVPPQPLEELPPANALDELLELWSRYLIEGRGLAPASAYLYTSFGRSFLSRVAGDDALLLKTAVTAESVTTFMVARSAEVSAGRLEAEASHLRSLLGFLFSRGLVGDLVHSVPSVASRRNCGVPKVLSADMVEGIGREIGTYPGTHYRNLAILALLAELGLRAQEVVDLKFEDIDWRSGTMVVRGKGSYREILPLTPTTGQALAGYLKHDTHRGPEERHVFHSAVGAYGPLGVNGVKKAVCNAANRAGFGPMGPHRFRHTLASRTLNAGASMEEVSQLLRHRSIKSTSIYAKVDFERLRLVVRPWPDLTIRSWNGGAS